MVIKLQQLREERGLSKRKFEEMSNVSRNWITKIEAGNANPGIDIMCKLAHALGVGLDELVQWDEN